MHPARWEQVQALFHRALGLNEPARSSFLGDACGEDEALLADLKGMLEADARSALVDGDVTEFAGGVLGDALSPRLKEFGPYRIRKLLGEGGMGVVYLAERTDLGNLVAIKILRDGWFSPARRDRFLIEQRTLAQLNHPSIARLYDANTLPDGTPFFVMEYVDGVAATEYCSRNQCSVEERLKLMRAVAEAVEYAHAHGVIHRDLKPSNIFVRQDGAVRLLDFGISKQLDSEGRPLSPTRTAFRSLTLAYASPEQIRGEPASKSTDVYSLGVVLYELLAGRLPFDLTGRTMAEAEQTIMTEEPPKPSQFAPRGGNRALWSDLDALCCTAMHKDPGRRYPSCAALARDIDHFLKQERIGAPPRRWPSEVARFGRRVLRKKSAATAISAALVLLFAVFGFIVQLSRQALSPARSRTVAVLPLQNATQDHSLDFLSQALADEISRTLNYARSLSLRPPEQVRRYGGPNVDLQAAGRALRVATVVSGRFIKAGDQVQIALNLTDVEKNRLIWTDVFNAPVRDMMAMQAQIASKTRRAMAPLLGVSEFVTDQPPRPTNEEAYQLYLRAMAMPEEISTNFGMRQQRIEMLNKSLALDPSYAPAWEALAWCYADSGWFGNGGAAAMARFRAVTQKAIALDPDNAVFRAGALYYWGTLGRPAWGDSGISRGQAYRELEDLIRRRPDNARLHFLASWILRDAGLLEQSARECDTSVLIDAQDAGARSCGVTFMLRGDYRRALDYVELDADSEVSKAILIDVLVRQGKVSEALQRANGNVPPWGGYAVLMAALEHRRAPETAALARQVQPATDPEINFFSAAHLAYAHQTGPALALLRRSIEGGYCSYPAIDSDPFFATLRVRPEFQEIRLAAQRCQNDFLDQRQRTKR